MISVDTLKKSENPCIDHKWECVAGEYDNETETYTFVYRCKECEEEEKEVIKR